MPNSSIMVIKGPFLISRDSQYQHGGYLKLPGAVTANTGKHAREFGINYYISYPGGMNVEQTVRR